MINGSEAFARIFQRGLWPRRGQETELTEGLATFHLFPGWLFHLTWDSIYYKPITVPAASSKAENENRTEKKKPKASKQIKPPNNWPKPTLGWTVHWVQQDIFLRNFQTQFWPHSVFFRPDFEV